MLNSKFYLLRSSIDSEFSKTFSHFNYSILMLNSKVQIWSTRKQFELLNIHAMELCTMSAVEDKRYNLKTFKEKVGEG